jgi:hypothetical protein
MTVPRITLAQALANAVERIEIMDQELYGAGCMIGAIEQDLAHETRRRVDAEQLLTAHTVARSVLCSFIDDLLPWAARGATVPLDWDGDRPVWAVGQELMQTRIAAGEFSNGRNLSFLDMLVEDDGDEGVTE